MSSTLSINNIYLIDTKMFGYDRFNSAYLVKGKELAMIDTGPATSTEAVRAGIESHGFTIAEIGYFFITHEHNDHSGNAGKFLKENSRANVYASPVDSEELTNPAKKRAWLKSFMAPKMLARFGELEPVPESRFVPLQDGDVFDLGNNERLRIIMAPGHQPSGLAIYSEISGGLFINDLVGLNLADAGAALMFTPPRSDMPQVVESLKKLMELPVSRLYIGHFGIWDNPRQVIQAAIDRIQRLMDIGVRCLKMNKPSEIENQILSLLEPELEKIKAVRGEEGIYKYFAGELVPLLAKNFSKNYLSLKT